MIETRELIAVIFIWIGFYISINAEKSILEEDNKKKQLGWLIIAIATLIDGILIVIDGRIGIATFILCIAVFDFWMCNYWRKKYNEEHLDKREKFLKDVMKYKR